MVANNHSFPSNGNKPKLPFVHLIRLLMLVFSIGVALGSGLGYGFSQAVSGTKQQEPSSQLESQHINRAEYERLEPGMSLAEVEAILNRGTEVNRSTTTATFVWQNSDGSGITVIFEDGKLKNKAQTGLK